jgi:hypothetical protein
MSVCWLQTAQYSTQIFSLAVLLSSLFVYNQMGGIDEAALDRCAYPVEAAAAAHQGADHKCNVHGWQSAQMSLWLQQLSKV